MIHSNNVNHPDSLPVSFAKIGHKRVPPVPKPPVVSAFETAPAAGKASVSRWLGLTSCK